MRESATRNEKLCMRRVGRKRVVFIQLHQVWEGQYGVRPTLANRTAVEQRFPGDAKT